MNNASTVPVLTLHQRKLERLRREWPLLQRADDWTVLGIPSDADAARIKFAGLRMKSRYAAIQLDPGLSEEGHELAAQIAQRVDEAIARIQAGSPRRAEPGPRQDPGEQAFQRGVKALKANDFSKAVRYFTVARRDDSSSARNMGYLGWALYNDARREDGRNLLQLSDSFDSAIDEVQYFLASIEFDAGDQRLAHARLRRLLARTADHAAAQVLLKKIKLV